jgi:hypothetical protein
LFPPNDADPVLLNGEGEENPLAALPKGDGDGAVDDPNGVLLEGAAPNGEGDEVPKPAPLELVILLDPNPALLLPLPNVDDPYGEGDGAMDGFPKGEGEGAFVTFPNGEGDGALVGFPNGEGGGAFDGFPKGDGV